MPLCLSVLEALLHYQCVSGFGLVESGQALGRLLRSFPPHNLSGLAFDGLAALASYQTQSFYSLTDIQL